MSFLRLYELGKIETIKELIDEVVKNKAKVLDEKESVIYTALFILLSYNSEELKQALEIARAEQEKFDTITEAESIIKRQKVKDIASKCRDILGCPASLYIECPAYLKGLNCWEVEEKPCCRRGLKDRRQVNLPVSIERRSGKERRKPCVVNPGCPSTKAAV